MTGAVGRTVKESPLHLALLWESIADDLLDRTSKFPRTARYSISERIDNLALDILESLVVARYATGGARRAALSSCNLRLARLRALLRLAHRRRLLGTTAYEHVSERLDESGRMLGAWLNRMRGTDAVECGEASTGVVSG